MRSGLCRGVRHLASGPHQGSDDLLTLAKMKCPFGVLGLIGPRPSRAGGVWSFASTFSQSVTGFSCSRQFHTFVHTVIPMTVDDFLSFSVLLEAAWKGPVIPAVGNSCLCRRKSNKNQGSVCCRVNCRACFQYRVEACKLSFLCSSITSGTLQCGLHIPLVVSSSVVIHCIFLGGPLVVGNLGFLPLLTVTPRFLPLSTVII